MKRFILLFTLLLPISLIAQNQSAIEEVSKAVAQISTMQCDFTQTKSLKMLGDKMVSQGKMSYSQNGSLRWEYVSPYSYIFILKDSKVTIKRGQRSNVIDINQNKLFRSIADIMMSTMTGKCLSNTRDFKVSAQGRKDGWNLTLLPLRKELRQMFQQIELRYDRSQRMVTSVVMKEKNGDSTVIELRNAQKNKKLNDSIFAL